MTPTLRRTLAAAALAALPVLAAAGPAAAAPQVVVVGEGGRAVAAPDAPTTVQVSGTGFQSVAGGFGGVYVLFGWVDPAAGDGWRPSAGGVSGTQYRYAVDVQGQENAGYQRFVAFPGSTTAVEANGGEVAEDGSWATDLTIPGATLAALDADGGTVEVDCRTVTCGVITIGAHGVANASNESFTPVAFADADVAAAAAAAEPTAEPGAEATGAPAAEPEPDASAASGGPAAADEDAGQGAAPWVVAGSAAAGAAAAGVAGVVGVRTARRRREAEAEGGTTPGAGTAPDDQDQSL
ncbi:hypothetical protein [Cellulomonas pakistanensis]|uniref:Htaa domain-containing protein n=1 Tax=Cellulomonas pakistanensis TaxID=992287 RepID=A0A919U6H0_9CELL|nr:hypothetical protein [Cellulomonas pakistanensis]GIG36999.1 hypothetical protein Cpa01nite_23800 [Cellulomonas pakistanensis]